MRPEPAFEELSAYVDNELRGRARVDLEEHLRDCESCRRRVEALRGTISAVQSLPQEAPPRPFTVPPQRRQRRFFPFAWPAWTSAGWVGGAAAAGLAALVLGTVLFVHPHAGGGASTALNAGPRSGRSDVVTQPNPAAQAAPKAAYNNMTGAVGTGRAEMVLATDQSTYAPDSTMHVLVHVDGPANLKPGLLTLVVVRNGSGVALNTPQPTTSGEITSYEASYSLASLGMKPSSSPYELIATWREAGSNAVLVGRLTITVR